MENPYKWARELLELSQQEVAEQLETSQQFIQRLEEGMAGSPHEALSDFYDGQVPHRVRLDYLADMLSHFSGSGVGVSPALMPNSPAFRKATMSRLYAQWVLFERGSLPDVSDILRYEREFGVSGNPKNKEVAQKIVTHLADRLGVLDESTTSTVYNVCKKIKVHPFILQRFIRSFPVQIPPHVRVALSQTGKGR